MCLTLKPCQASKGLSSAGMPTKSQHSPAYEPLLALLRALREEAELTQRALGELLGKPQSWVHNCEVGNRRVDVAEFTAWATACGRPRRPRFAVSESERGNNADGPRRETRCEIELSGRRHGTSADRSNHFHSSTRIAAHIASVGRHEVAGAGFRPDGGRGVAAELSLNSRDRRSRLSRGSALGRVIVLRLPILRPVRRPVQS